MNGELQAGSAQGRCQPDRQARPLEMLLNRLQQQSERLHTSNDQLSQVLNNVGGDGCGETDIPQEAKTSVQGINGTGDVGKIAGAIDNIQYQQDKLEEGLRRLRDAL